ncbi:MAG: hypothetical protein WBR10_07690 [Candidatus Acidiferrum sp.]
MGTAGQAGDIVADVRHNGRARDERKHSVERRNAMNLRWGQIHAQGHVVQGTGAYPSCAGLNRVQNGKKQVTAR